MAPQPTPENEQEQGSPVILADWAKGKNWFEQYEFIELEVKAHPDQAFEQIGARIGVPDTTINRAMKIMRVLNENSRRMIRENLSQGREGP